MTHSFEYPPLNLKIAVVRRIGVIPPDIRTTPLISEILSVPLRGGPTFDRIFDLGAKGPLVEGIKQK